MLSFPPPPQRKHYNQRKGTCTHTRTSRQFNETLKCNHCHRPGNQGWLYRCTQDYDGRLPLHESGLTHQEKEGLIAEAQEEGWILPGLSRPHGERLYREEEDHEGLYDVSILKPWTRKAIIAGGYTAEQIDTLVAQRIDVRATIKADEARLVEREKKRLAKLRCYPGLGQTSKGTTNQESHALAVDGHEERPSSDWEWSDTESNLDLLESNLELSRKAALCDYRCCSTCRPVLRERAWTPLDSIITPEDPHLFPQDIDMRPLASLGVVLGIDLERFSKLSIQKTDSNGSASNQDGSSFDQYYFPRHDLRANGTSNGSRPSEDTNSTESSSNHSHSSESLHPFDDDEDEDRFEALNVARPQSRLGQSWFLDAVEGDLSDFTSGFANSSRGSSIAEILSLPGLHEESSKDSNRDYQGGEIHVPHGVALTEEAVDTGLADIITQV